MTFTSHRPGRGRIAQRSGWGRGTDSLLSLPPRSGGEGRREQRERRGGGVPFAPCSL